jgi:hypothetical protein
MIFLLYVDGICGFGVFNPAFSRYLWLKLLLVSRVTVTEFPVCAITVVNCDFVVCRSAQCVNFRIVIVYVGMAG